MGKNSLLSLGIDIGGTGIKGGIVDLKTGALISDRFRYDTPPEATPKDVGVLIKKILKDANWSNKVGCGFPGIIKDGICKSANIRTDWKQPLSRSALLQPVLPVTHLASQQCIRGR